MRFEGLSPVFEVDLSKAREVQKKSMIKQVEYRHPNVKIVLSESVTIMALVVGVIVGVIFLSLAKR